jgi:serine O-acetyltransferase
MNGTGGESEMLMSATVQQLSDTRHAALWETLRQEAEEIARAEPFLAGLAERFILFQDDFPGALAAILGAKLEGEVSAAALAALASQALIDNPAIADAAAADLLAVRDRDPAVTRLAVPLLYFKGYQGLQAHRLAHHFWLQGRQWLALHLQSLVSERFSMDIHPAALIGQRVLIDHGTGLVVGETAVIGNDVSILQNVTLGGTGKQTGDRHPKVGDGVLIGAGAKILGNIDIGRCAKIGASSVVLNPVEAYTTVAGVPARVMGGQNKGMPGVQMDHSLPEWVHFERGGGI